jgi:hypothetical protein
MDNAGRIAPRIAGPVGGGVRDKGLTEQDLVHINLGWHRLNGWPDSVPGLTRLKTRFVIGPLSNGNVSLLTYMAKHAGLPWDMVFGSDLFGHFKPDPETYLGVAKLMDLAPDQVMMAAAHNADLGNARKCGLMTAFFPRPKEYGPNQKRDYSAEQDWDIVAKDIEDLATQRVLSRPTRGHEAADISRHRGDIRGDMRKELPPPHAGVAQLVRLHRRHAALVHHQPARVRMRAQFW